MAFQLQKCRQLIVQLLLQTQTLSGFEGKKLFIEGIFFLTKMH